MNGKINEAYGSEGEFVGKDTLRDGGSVCDMPNGSGKVNWEAIKVIAQYLIYPIAAVLIYLVIQNANFDRRLAIIEYTTASPRVDVVLVKQLAILEDRQNRMIDLVNVLEGEMKHHRENSTYDPVSPNYRK